MSRYDYINQLKELLKDVNEEDAKIIVEEYEDYINEEVKAGKDESEVIASLENVEDVAQNVIDELGNEERVKPVIQISKGDILIEKNGKRIQIDQDGLNINGEFVINNKKDYDHDEEPTEYKHLTLDDLDVSKKVVIEADNLPISIVPGDERTKVKNLPSYIDADIIEEESVTRIVFKADRKPMFTFNTSDIKIELSEEVDQLDVINENGPTLIDELELEALKMLGKNGPISMRNLNVSFCTVSMKNGPLLIKDCEFDSLESENKNGPCTIKDIEANHIKVTVKNGPVTFKNNHTNFLSFKSGNGPCTVKDIELTEGDIRIGDGPTTVKNIDGQKLILKTGRGPVTKKDIDVSELITN
jgi:predicted regulator of Ras-like GTPase activity (Roadblock/LC7/MglB family)